MRILNNSYMLKKIQLYYFCLSRRFLWLFSVFSTSLYVSVLYKYFILIFW